MVPEAFQFEVSHCWAGFPLLRTEASHKCPQELQLRLVKRKEQRFAQAGLLCASGTCKFGNPPAPKAPSTESQTA